MDRGWMALADGERLLAATGLEHVVAVALQHLAGHAPDWRLVFHQEDGFLAAPCCRRRRFRSEHLGRLLDPGQINLEGRPCPRLAVQPDEAAALPHDAV